MKLMTCWLIAAVMLAGCAAKAPAIPRLHSPVETARELLAVDREFARLAAEQGAAVAFGSFSDERSVRINPVGPNTVGRAAFVAELRELPVGALVWEPRSAEAAHSGDLGWTWGDYVFHTPKGDRRGRYLTVWRLTPAGWRIAADIGAQDSAGQP